MDYLLRVALVRAAHLVIVHSLAAKRQVAWYFGRCRGVVHVPLGHLVGVYPNSVSRAEARRQLGIPESAAVYLLFGNIRPYKGVEELIDAFRLLPDGDSRLVLAGSVAPEFSADDVKRYRERLLERIGGDPRIRPHFGTVANEDLQIYFNAADISVLPFRRILTSASLMLSLSFGVPVVVPRIPSIVEYVNDEVAYVMDADEDLTTALRRANERRCHGSLRSGDAVLRWVLQFDWNEAAKTVAEAFRRRSMRPACEGAGEHPRA